MFRYRIATFEIRNCSSSFQRITSTLILSCGLAASWTAQARAAEIVLHNFGSPPNGALPYAGVIRDAAGNLYGTTFAGAAGSGVVYKVDTTGHETVMYTFTGYSDGGNPYGGLTADSAGNLYGTVSTGGQSARGGVYEVNASGETMLYSFTGGADGGTPYAGVIRDAAGNVYGTTNNGGSAGAGVVYKVDATGHETVLYTFTGGADGGHPYAGVIRDSAGNLYGTTFSGGTANKGVVYVVGTTGHETVLHTFIGGADGAQPYAGVIGDASGNLYGTTTQGGTGNSGVVYKLDKTLHETVLYTFTGGTDGDNPYAGLIRDAAGNLYGTMFAGGSGNSGVVYKVNSTAQETVLHNFTDVNDGGQPYAGLVIDSANNLYGTTYGGGAGLAGVVYKVDNIDALTVIYSFPQGGTDGASAVSALIGDGAGNLYGTTLAGGTAFGGTVYKMDRTGTVAVLHDFTTAAGGYQPWSAVLRDPSGNLYGTTYAGGLSGGKAANGVLYKIDPSGNETVLHTFAGGSDGAILIAGVVRDSSGNLYGTASYGGGAAEGGIVYKFDAAGNYTVLYRFTGGADGSQPHGGVILDAAGNLYGTTYNGGTADQGVVYKLDTTGHETVLYTFTGGADGGQPYCVLLRDAAGNFYGTTVFGGTFNKGVMFKLDTTGHETVLYTFTGGADGSEPFPGLIADPAGNLYGIAAYGGSANEGTVFKLDTTGNFTLLYTFTGPNGNQPWSGVIRDSAGNLYGTTYRGGSSNVGVIYALTP